MSGRKRFFIAVGLLFAMVTLLRAEDKADEQAKEAATRFMKAVKARNVDEVMKTVQVPWFHNGKRVIKDRPELKTEFEKLFEKQDFAGIGFEIKQVVPYSSVRTKVNDKERALLDEVVEKDDRVVLVAVEKPDAKAKEEKVTLLVKPRDGKWAVVGLRD